MQSSTRATNPKVLVIDNYDSFTFNLVQYLQQSGAEVEITRNDAIDEHDLRANDCDAWLISPGPSSPDHAGISLNAIHLAIELKKPLLGVCLGHQCLGAALGASISRIHPPLHGKTSSIMHDGQGVFRNLPSPIVATRYHSLVVERKNLPECLKVSAEADDGTIMGLRHRSLPIEGVQFHPESVLTEHGLTMIQNFLRQVHP
jgi:anthranilate synthase/aminodeoxychorismate synthase-like glutamine amidotransferase